MRHALRLFQATAALGVAVLCAGASTGCQEAATAATAAVAADTAATVVQTTAVVVKNIPELVQQAVDLFINQNNLSWGKPERIVVTDTDYVFMYPTTQAQLKKNGGIPRMIVIRRNDAQQQPN